MAKVLLIRPFFQSPESMPIYPLGLAYLAAVLRKFEHKVVILDLPLLKIENKHIMRLVNKFKPELIGITALSYYFTEMIELCKFIKGYSIVIGGLHPSVLPELSLNQTNADYLIMGEGEETLIELIEYLDNGGDITKIKGLAYKQNGEITINEQRGLIKNLDEIPFPSWDLLKLELYNPPVIREFNLFFNPDPALPIITSRGCPYKCTYCASTKFWGPSIRYRTIRNVIEEILFNIERYKIKTIEIWDDNFTLNRQRVIDFCKEVIKRNLDISFYLPNGVRIDSLDRALIRLMKHAGFKGIVIAPESGSQKILDNVKKKLDLNIVKDVARVLQEEGILTSAYFILGLPGETNETAYKTIKFGASLPLNGISYFIFTPLPGSELFDLWSKDINLEKINWKFDYFVYHNSKEYTMCDLTFSQLKKFQKLGFISYLLKIKNLRRFLKRLNIHNIKIFFTTELRNLLFLLKRKN